MTQPRRDPDHRAEGERGQVGGIEVLPFALLIFVVGILLVANAWAAIDAKMAASAAAREAARPYAELPAGSDAGDGWARAAQAGADAFAAYDLPADRLELRPVLDPGPTRCARVVVEANIRLPIIVVPWVGGFTDGLVIRARHSELVDPYRSGLEGPSCA